QKKTKNIHKATPNYTKRTAHCTPRARQPNRPSTDYWARSRRSKAIAPKVRVTNHMDCRTPNLGSCLQ
ncbi:MAG: hypothetical protein ABSD29_20810, partial [Verrucomicrobiota bacterium]